MNDPRSLSREITPENGRLKKARSVNFTFVDKGTARLVYTMSDAFLVRVTRNISSGEELVLDYSENCRFKQIYKW